MDDAGIDLDYVTSNLNRSVTLIGSNLAIFTFVLIFLYPRYLSNQLNGVLFQATLTSSLLACYDVSSVGRLLEVERPGEGAVGGAGSELEVICPLDFPVRVHLDDRATAG